MSDGRTPFLGARENLAAGADAAQTANVCFVQWASRVRDPEFVVGEDEADCGWPALNACHSVVGILEQLENQPAAIVLGDLALLPDILAEPLRAGAIDIE